MRQNYASLLLLSAALISAACGNFTAPDAKRVAGQYAISTVNGKPLPFTLADSSQLAASVLKLSETGGYEETMYFYGKSSLTFHGRFAVSASQIVVEMSNGQGFTLDIANFNTLIENDDNMGIVVYVRR